MKLSTRLHNQLADATLSPSERALLRCQLAKELEEAGDYEAAFTALTEFWSGLGDAPAVSDLDEPTKAEVLLRAGVLTGWIGSARQIEGAQEKAKDLISQSITIFEALTETRKLAEAHTEIAVCYWRQGAFDEARLILRDTLLRLPANETCLKAVVYLRSALLENSATRFNDSFRILTEALPLFQDEGASHALRGKFHNTLALVLRSLGTAEQREDYIDRALIEYAAASFHFEQAGHTRYQACVENNLGFLFLTLEKFTEAHEHLDHARRLLVDLRDHAHIAQVDDTRARVLLAERRDSEAERVAQTAVEILEKGGEQSLLAEALTTLGIARARTGQHERSCRTLRRAIEIAEQAGDLESAGIAALSIIEELHNRFTAGELVETHERVRELLSSSRQQGVLKRMLSGAYKVIDVLRAQLASVNSNEAQVEQLAADHWEGFNLKREVRRFERLIIERALKDADGIVTRAAQLLGFRHHQSLISLINNKHQDLIHARSALRPRRRSILVDRHNSKGAATLTAEKGLRKISILHVEDNELVANLIKDILVLEGWTVEACRDGETALRTLMSNARYDLLIFDYQLPGLNGLELIRRTRKIPHRRRTPIIMLSGTDCETEAWRAGVNAFLRKAEDTNILPSTIVRLLRVEPKDV